MTILSRVSNSAKFLLFVQTLARHQPAAGFFFMGEMASKSATMPTAEEALPGRAEAIKVSSKHAVNGNKAVPPFPENMEQAMFGMGCFWGAERKFWKAPGIYSTQVGYSGGFTPNPTYREVCTGMTGHNEVGYSGGFTPNPTYREVCTGMTGHNEVVRVIYDPDKISYGGVLKVFWENHDPTTLNRQGNDVGTQYRSGVYYYTDAQKNEAEATKEAFEKLLLEKGHSIIKTEIVPAKEFYYAEDYHQQYLHKNPGGYCGLGGTGVSCPIGLGAKKAAEIENAEKKKSEL